MNLIGIRFSVSLLLTSWFTVQEFSGVASNLTLEEATDLQEFCEYTILTNVYKTCNPPSYKVSSRIKQHYSLIKRQNQTDILKGMLDRQIRALDLTMAGDVLLDVKKVMHHVGLSDPKLVDLFATGTLFCHETFVPNEKKLYGDEYNALPVFCRRVGFIHIPKTVCCCLIF